MVVWFELNLNKHFIQSPKGHTVQKYYDTSTRLYRERYLVLKSQNQTGKDLDQNRETGEKQGGYRGRDNGENRKIDGDRKVCIYYNVISWEAGSMTIILLYLTLELLQCIFFGRNHV